MKPIELTEEMLLSVRKPARYVGQEHNMIKKDWSDDIVKVCLCFPDLYEIGMSHLGLKILYDIVNKRNDALCERSFAPGIDMEEVMIKNKIPLFSLESKMGLSAFDIIGFSLQHELTYTNLLNMLHLSGIPLKAKERVNGNFPLIIAGGTCAFNPEPLSDFIDAFVIGDGEEAIGDIIEAYKRIDKGGTPLLEELSTIEGVYVPRCHDGSKKIKKRLLKELKDEYFPTAPIVPYITTVHDRVTLEIMRGCPNKCSFCQATHIYSPVRIRKPENILKLAKETYENTGLDEVSLLSLSSSNYPQISKLISGLTEVFKGLGVGISLPSLRIEEQLDKLPSLISAVKKSGLTFAPEVGTEKMLDVINKQIDFEELFRALKKAYKAGWRKIKLYFMIGLPDEENNDVEAIIELADKVAKLKKEVSSHPADVTVSVSSFIPKPHTPFERLSMASADALKSKQGLLKKRVFKKKYLRLKWHDVETSILEGVFSRGDSRLGDVLKDAWEAGARFDSWDEHFKPQIWEEAFLKNNINKDDYLTGYGTNERLAWDHIGIM